MFCSFCCLLQEGDILWAQICLENFFCDVNQMKWCPRGPPVGPAPGHLCLDTTAHRGLSRGLFFIRQLCMHSRKNCGVDFDNFAIHLEVLAYRIVHLQKIRARVCTAKLVGDFRFGTENFDQVMNVNHNAAGTRKRLG